MSITVTGSAAAASPAYPAAPPRRVLLGGASHGGADPEKRLTVLHTATQAGKKYPAQCTMGTAASMISALQKKRKGKLSPWRTKPPSPREGVPT